MVNGKALTASIMKLLLTAHCLLLRLPLGQPHQLFGHPLADAFGRRFLDADGAVVPRVDRLRAALLLVILRLFETEHDAVDYLFPIPELDTAHDEGEPGGPV